MKISEESLDLESLKWRNGQRKKEGCQQKLRNFKEIGNEMLKVEHHPDEQ